MPTSIEPSALSEKLLADELPRRWNHVQGVAMKATILRSVVGAAHSQLLTDAAVLHDIGYASDLVDTGFHPIDGARHLRRCGFDERIVNLVAHHTCARIEAELRGLGQILVDEFPIDETLPHETLCFCDITVSPVGEAMTLDQRLAEIRDRYASGHIVQEFVTQAEPELRRMVAKVAAEIEAHPKCGTSPDWA